MSNRDGDVKKDLSERKRNDKSQSKGSHSNYNQQNKRPQKTKSHSNYDREDESPQKTRSYSNYDRQDERIQKTRSRRNYNRRDDRSQNRESREGYEQRYSGWQNEGMPKIMGKDGDELIHRGFSIENVRRLKRSRRRKDKDMSVVTVKNPSGENSVGKKVTIQQHIEHDHVSSPYVSFEVGGPGVSVAKYAPKPVDKNNKPDVDKSDPNHWRSSGQSYSKKNIGRNEGKKYIGYVGSMKRKKYRDKETDVSTAEKAISHDLDEGSTPFKMALSDKEILIEPGKEGIPRKDIELVQKTKEVDEKYYETNRERQTRNKALGYFKKPKEREYKYYKVQIPDKYNEEGNYSYKIPKEKQKRSGTRSMSPIESMHLDSSDEESNSLNVNIGEKRKKEYIEEDLHIKKKKKLNNEKISKDKGSDIESQFGSEDESNNYKSNVSSEQSRKDELVSLLDVKQDKTGDIRNFFGGPDLTKRSMENSKSISFSFNNNIVSRTPKKPTQSMQSREITTESVQSYKITTDPINNDEIDDTKLDEMKTQFGGSVKVEKQPMKNSNRYVLVISSDNIRALERAEKVLDDEQIRCKRDYGSDKKFKF